jgi:hypothetical protein
VHFGRALKLFVLTLSIAAASSSAFAFDAGALSKATDLWNTLVVKYVRPDGGVNYIGLNGERAALDTFLKSYAALDFKGASDAVKKAAYINFYNAMMMSNLLRYAQETKIDVASKDFTNLEINGLKVPGGDIWSGDYKGTISGQPVNLDDVEHKLIRGNGADNLAPLKVAVLDPRIHAAVNCAALSCPRVRDVAYRPETVETMLDENIREYLSSDAQFSKVGDDKMRANQIVFWYYDDFDDAGKKMGLAGAGGFLGPFIAPTAKDHDWKVKHLRENFNDRSKVGLKLSSAFDFFYDWHVNDVRNKK